MSRRIPMSVVGDDSERARIFLINSVVGALVAQGGRLDISVLTEALLPARLPPIPAYIEGATYVIVRGICDAEENGYVIVLGRMVVLTLDGAKLGHELFTMILREMGLTPLGGEAA